MNLERVPEKKLQEKLMVRLQTYLRDCGIASRRRSEELILKGQVEVNSERVSTLGIKIDPSKDKVTIKGKLLSPATKKLFIFNKPRQVVTTNADPQRRKCVGDYIRKTGLSLFPVGRLDYDVSGLLLLTNDGDLADKLLHPKYEVPRVYLAIILGAAKSKDLSRLFKGVLVDGEKVLVKEAKLIPQTKYTIQTLRELSAGESLIEVTVAEGRKHFVKKLLYSWGFPVKVLSRVSFGKYRLGNIAVGEMSEVKLS
jgi:23S rRNA pseudouridine2605 synthase